MVLESSPVINEEHNPLKQGLKRLDITLTNLSKINEEHNPLKQGLKHWWSYR